MSLKVFNASGAGTALRLQLHVDSTYAAWRIARIPVCRLEGAPAVQWIHNLFQICTVTGGMRAFAVASGPNY